MVIPNAVDYIAVGPRQLSAAIASSSTLAGEHASIVAGGTLLEGLGSPLSDLDLYVIDKAKPTLDQVGEKKHDYINPFALGGDAELVHEVFDYSSNSGISTNIEYWTIEETERLIEKLHREYEKSLHHSTRLHRNLFSYKEKAFLHRVKAGRCLQNGRLLEGLFARFNQAEFCYINYRQWMSGYDNFRDIIGAYASGDLNHALLLLHTHLSEQAFGMTFLTGDTNPNPKWLLAKLRRLPERYSVLAARCEAFLIGDRGSSHVLEAIQTGFDLLDDVYEAARMLLKESKLFPSPALGLRLVREEHARRRAARDTQSFDLDHQFSYREKMFSDSSMSSRVLADMMIERLSALREEVRSG